jgi:hypothetical protein
MYFSLQQRLCADFFSYILDMKNDAHVSLRCSLVLILLLQVYSAWAQFTPLVEVQGESMVSPFEGQMVAVTGKVTEYFGDTWYMQDDFGAWNGIYVVGPDVSIASNPPYWSGDRQPEVGDVLEITGMVAEINGNTTIVDAVLTNFVDFWNATAMGIWLTADEFQDEQYEGTRVRIDNATIITSPDADGYWTVSDGAGEVKCWGIDADDPANNEDPDGPTPGDVYQIYGAMHQIGDEYVLHVGDIDVLSLSLNEQTKRAAFRMYPNPASEVLILANVEPQNARNNGQLVCKDLQGRIVEVFDVSLGEQLDISALQSGTYLVDWTPSHLPSTHSSTFSQKLMIR